MESDNQSQGLTTESEENQKAKLRVKSVEDLPQRQWSNERTGYEWEAKLGIESDNQREELQQELNHSYAQTQ